MIPSTDDRKSIAWALHSQFVQCVAVGPHGDHRDVRNVSDVRLGEPPPVFASGLVQTGCGEPGRSNPRGCSGRFGCFRQLPSPLPDLIGDVELRCQPRNERTRRHGLGRQAKFRIQRRIRVRYPGLLDACWIGDIVEGLRPPVAPTRVINVRGGHRLDRGPRRRSS